jgi:hypothetical protein
LCGPLLRPFARHLRGVDLSERMLQNAKARGGYDALHKAELTAFIQNYAHAFDLIVSADTLCYFGDLEPVCRAAHRALRPGGTLLFTVEALADRAAARSVAHGVRRAGPRLRRARSALETNACWTDVGPQTTTIPGVRAATHLPRLRAMQHLLDFIQEHTLDDQLYLVATCPTGELELLWRRGVIESHWQIRPKRSDGPWELIHRSEVIAQLEQRGADMAVVKRELQAMLASLIAFADMVLRDANQQLGEQLVERFVSGHRAFIQELEVAIGRLTDAPQPAPAMEVVPGGGAQTSVRTGHLSIVRVR